MLELKNISKDYISEDYTVHALKDVSIRFRDAEFVSILGPSGCGKTTLLNVIGGLDRYTDGELIIDDVLTKDYKDRDWDNYRNHKIGFVFQSYNLIPYQTVLGNVELALQLSGMKKNERRHMAIQALEKVGLKDQIKKTPSQLSGGQMQRVAIARAIVNNPSIILADEPTGALDTETSVQVMELLKELSHECLVIMVTHNPELARTYSSRILKLADGTITHDSNPIKKSELKQLDETMMLNLSSINKKEKKPKMSWATAFGLSMRNLNAKKRRTASIGVAGAIGIIGMALILSMSDGFQNYIDKVQQDALSTYPIQISHDETDYTSVLEVLMGELENTEIPDENKIYTVNILSELLENFKASSGTNNLNAFKDYIEDHEEIKEKVTGIKYSYGVGMQLFNSSKQKVYPSSFSTDLITSYMRQAMNNPSLDASKYVSTYGQGLKSISGGLFTEMIDNQNLIESQFDLVAGEWPWESKKYASYEDYQKVVLVVDKNNSAPDYRLYQLGLLDGDYQQIVDDYAAYTLNKINTPPMTTLDIKNLIGREYKLVLNPELFTKDGDYYKEISESELYSNLDDSTYGEKIILAGVVREKPNATATSINPGSLAFTNSLTKYAINKCNNSQIVKDQLEDKTNNIFKEGKYEDEVNIYTRDDLVFYMNDIVSKTAGAPTSDFAYGEYIVQGLEKTIEEKKAMFDEYINENEGKKEIVNRISKDLYSKNVDEIDMDQYVNLILYLMMNFEDPTIGFYREALNAYNQSYSYERTKKMIGIYDEDSLESISVYCVSFEAKDEFEKFVKEYNNTVNENDKIKYTDYVGLIMKSISKIIRIISSILIGFVSISLIVSTIMIGIVTYLSVLERTKEIGVLRSLGASKGDIVNLINAETMLLGIITGGFGVGLTIAIDAISNYILNTYYPAIGSIANLPWWGALGLVSLSVVLTFISGLIPSQAASNKDPVIALRSE